MKFWRPIYDTYPFLRQMEEADVVLLSLTLVLFFILVFNRQYVALLFTSFALLFFNMFFIIDLPKFPFQFPYMNKDFPLFIRVVSLIIGVWGVIHYFKEVMVTILRSDSVVDRWNYIVEQGAGKGDFVLGTTERTLIDAKMPGVTTRREEVAIELFGEKRPFLIVQNAKYKEFKMYINARDLASIMASATPFCFCTTQKHLAVKISRNSRA